MVILSKEELQIKGDWGESVKEKEGKMLRASFRGDVSWALISLILPSVRLTYNTKWTFFLSRLSELSSMPGPSLYSIRLGLDIHRVDPKWKRIRVRHSWMSIFKIKEEIEKDRHNLWCQIVFLILILSLVFFMSYYPQVFFTHSMGMIWVGMVGQYSKVILLFS